MLTGKYRAMMLMMDLDHFKTYNDTYGHVAGDEYLRLMASTLRNAVRGDDLCSRMGGDEFAAMLFFPADASEELLRARAAAVFGQVSEALKEAGKGYGISAGAVYSDDRIDSFQEMYAAADQALYRSKAEGRGRLSVYQEKP